MTGRADDDKCRGGKAITKSVRCSREHSGHSLPTDSGVWEAAHLHCVSFCRRYSQSCFLFSFINISIYSHGNTAVNHCYDHPAVPSVIRNRNTLWTCHTHTEAQLRVSNQMLMFLICGRKLVKSYTNVARTCELHSERARPQTRPGHLCHYAYCYTSVCAGCCQSPAHVTVLERIHAHYK